MKRDSLIDGAKLVITILALEKHIENPVDLSVGSDLDGRMHLFRLTSRSLTINVSAMTDLNDDDQPTLIVD